MTNDGTQGDRVLRKLGVDMRRVRLVKRRRLGFFLPYASEY